MTATAATSGTSGEPTSAEAGPASNPATTVDPATSEALTTSGQGTGDTGSSMDDCYFNPFELEPTEWTTVGAGWNWLNNCCYHADASMGSTAVVLGGHSWLDMSVSHLITVGSDSRAGVVLRAQPDLGGSNLYVELDSTSGRVRASAAGEVLLDVPAMFQPGAIHTLEVDFVGDTASVRLNDVNIGDAFATPPIAGGSIAFQVTQGDSYFDDIQVCPSD